MTPDERSTQSGHYSHGLGNISVVILCRDEASFIEPCVESIAAQARDFQDFEIIVVDGMSTDGTRAIVDQLARKYDFLKMVDNPDRITPAAMNLGIQAARGDVVAIFSAHASYAQGYLAACVAAMESHGADQVGGIAEFLPRRNSPFGRAIAASLTTPLGGGGSARYKTGTSAPRWVDTVWAACFRRSTLKRVGPFDQRLRRSQDIEFALRMKRMGGRTLLIPRLGARYWARAHLLEAVRYNFVNGYWVTYPLRFGVRAASGRHYVPLGSLISAAGLLVLSLRWGTPAPLAFAALSYSIVLVGSGVYEARSRSDWLLIATLPIAVAGLHIPYALGSLAGLVTGVTRSVIRKYGRLVTRRAEDAKEGF